VELMVHGRLAGAELDVVAHEPVVPQQLREIDNVVALPWAVLQHGHAQRWPSWSCAIWMST
jgi:lactate dehydrogenase-like 2-hydroxyacid dehydrogenase